MRHVSLALLMVVFACLLLAQTPIGLGPGTIGLGQIGYFNWHLATASGCSNTPPGGTCVGIYPVGDTLMFQAWFPEAYRYLLPAPSGLPIVGMMNDTAADGNTTGNFMVWQLADFDWDHPLASRMFLINRMAGYGTSTGTGDTPHGWYGHCTSGDNFNSSDCSYKAVAPFFKNGKLYLWVFRAQGAGNNDPHDLSLITSEDGGQTWKNPYTYYNAGASRADGDPPRCDAAQAGSAYPCLNAAYNDATHSSVMWKGYSGDGSLAREWFMIHYGREGSYPTDSGVTDGCDPNTYSCFCDVMGDGACARVANADVMDPAAWQYYTCPAVTSTYRCPGSASSSWTHTYADRTRVFELLPGGWGFEVIYEPTFKSYVLSGPGNLNLFATSPSIFGPWTKVGDATTLGSYSQPDFFYFLLGAWQNIVSTKPPHTQYSMIGQWRGVNGNAPEFGKIDFVPGRIPTIRNTEMPQGNAGYIISDSHVPGSIPRKGVEWVFDFYDHGGNTASSFPGFHEVANSSAFLLACSQGCGYFTPDPGPGYTYGMLLKSYGAMTLYRGYNAHFVTTVRDTPQTDASRIANTSTGGLTLKNIPASLQGNRSFTVAGVFRREIDGGSGGTLWYMGGGNPEQGVGLNFDQAPGSGTNGANLRLDWGGSDHWRYNSGFTLQDSNWYFIAATVEAQAAGQDPKAHLWIGIDGKLVDKLAGISRTEVGGSGATKTPNVVAAPFVTGADTNASYASLFVYSRDLSQPELGLMYNTVKKKMALRRVTLQ